MAEGLFGCHAECVGPDPGLHKPEAGSDGRCGAATPKQLIQETVASPMPLSPCQSSGRGGCSC